MAHQPLPSRTLHFGFAALTLAGSWLLMGTLFCFHYAHMYYMSPAAARPLAFPNGYTQPDYLDFLYFAFTINVAAQTSDVTVLTPGLRRFVLAQSVLCFFFNLSILGLSVNIAAALINP